ncbi:MAG: glutamate--tRNA ligase [Candidatus Jorgensenbacteria bacterium]
MPVKVRFAPSPTGFLHIGGVRTALFNWLFARHEGGSFVIRIEDTDRERSEKRFEDDIIQSFAWLGITSDEPVMRQSERRAVYARYLGKLLEERKAYRCFCTPETLDADRDAQMSQGLVPKYLGGCWNLPPAEAEARAAKEPSVIRFRMPEKAVTFTDLIRGKVSFDLTLVGDVIIAKGLEEPLYNFAVVVDDEETDITHVIRGEEHLSNTPKQIAFQEALGFRTPAYAHLPLILGHDRKKLSKRDLSKSVIDYRADGYLPEALLNFLVLLGWHPVRDREVLTVPEMVAEFTLPRVQKGGAVWNPEKLEWLNAQHLRHLSPEKLAAHLEPFVPPHWLGNKEFFTRVLALEQERLGTLKEFAASASFFFELPNYPAELLQWKGTATHATLENLDAAMALIKKAKEKSFTPAWLEKELFRLAEERGRGEFLWPLRVALSGREASPGPVEIAVVLGRAETMNRLQIAIEKLGGGGELPS